MPLSRITTFSNCVAMVANLAFDMRMHPKSRFTQFCSAQTLLRSGCTIFAGVLGGLYFDSLRGFFADADFAYRLSFVWTSFWGLISIWFICSLYHQWRALGGDLHSHVPVPWSQTGYEEQEHSPFVGPQTKWINRRMAILHAAMLLSVLYLLPLMYWLRQARWSVDHFWHLTAILPAAIAIYLCWVGIERAIRAAMRRDKAGELLGSGIPRHGLLLFKSGALLLLLVVWIGITLVGIHDRLEGGMIVLGNGNIVTNIAFILAVLVFATWSANILRCLPKMGTKTRLTALIPRLRVAVPSVVLSTIPL